MEKQKLEYIDACDVANAYSQIAKKTKEMNDMGYILSILQCQSDGGKSHSRTTAILVFNHDDE